MCVSVCMCVCVCVVCVYVCVCVYTCLCGVSGVCMCMWPRMHVIVAKAIATALVTSRLDYYNSLFIMLPLRISENYTMTSELLSKGYD